MERIKTKSQMYRGLTLGKFGNTFRMWPDPEHFEGSGFTGLCGVRLSGKPGSPYWHHLTPGQTLLWADILRSSGATPVIYEASPDYLLLLQGEVAQTELGVTLRYSTVKTHMRAAFQREELYLSGLRAVSLLKSTFNEESYGDLFDLFELYPGHVVEFSVYRSCVGTLRGRNAVIWEVRDY